MDMNTEIMKKNHDGTFQWKSSKIKDIFHDFDGKVDDRIITGTAGNHRTQAITFKPTGCNIDTVEVIGVNKSIEIDHKNRKNADVEFLEVRTDSKEEQVLICTAILVDRLSKIGIEVIQTGELKRVWKKGGYAYTD